MNLDAQGKYKEAEPLIRRALEIRQRVWGANHPDVANSYNNLASNLQAQGTYAEAEPLLRKSLMICRQALGEHHPHTATCYTNLALNLNAQGKYTEAEPLIRRALEICRRAFGEDSSDTAETYGHLASNLEDQGKGAEADEMARKALQIQQRTLGEDHSRTATAYDNLGWHLYMQGEYQAAESQSRRALEIFRRALGENHHQTAICYNNLALILDAQGKYTEAEPLLRRGLEICRRAFGEDSPDTATSYHHLAGNLYAQGLYGDAEEKWIAAARGFEATRFWVSFIGLERVTFAEGHSPLPYLAAILARRGQSAAAWQKCEANYARGLLDDLSARQARPLRPDERQHEHELIVHLQRLDKNLSTLLSSAGSAERLSKQAEALKDQRDAVQAEFTQFEADLAQKYGPSAGKVYDLARIQAHLPPHTALIGWLDIMGKPKAADLNGEHWACVVRHRGDPIWVKLPGSGPAKAWTEADNELPKQVGALCMSRRPDPAKNWIKLANRLAKQRLSPLEPHLGASRDIPAVTHLVILPSQVMARVPVETLVVARTADAPRYTISYAPSGTMFAWLQERRQEAEGKKGRRAASLRLLALGDPVFARPDLSSKPAPSPPNHGALISMVLPGSNADQGGLKPGDVVLRYAEVELAGPADLIPAIQKRASQPPAGETRGVAGILPLKIWRDGQTLELTVRPGRLGVKPSDRPAAESIRDAREADVLIDRSRGVMPSPLPGSRREVRAIAKLFLQAEMLLGSDASEQRLDQLASSDRLREFNILHLATHGLLNSEVAMQSALFLSQDGLPDPLKQVLNGQEAYDGRLTAEQILRTWNLDAELVTLSACQTGLGRIAAARGTSGSPRPSSWPGAGAWS